MTDLLTIASSALSGYRAALAAVGENVAGADAPGFARRDVRLASAASDPAGPLDAARGTGLGVRVAELRRARDGLAAARLRDAQSTRAALEATHTWLLRIEPALQPEAGGLSPTLTAFNSAAAAVAADPASTVKRDLFLAAADDVAGRFRATARALGEQSRSLNTELGSEVADLQATAGRLASINERLVHTREGSSPRAALLDERDRLLSDLAERAGIEVSEGARGTVTVRLGDSFGPMLVGPRGAALVELDPGTPPGVRIAGEGGSARVAIVGGSIGGLLAAAARAVDATAALNGLAAAFAGAVNAAHQSGADLSGTRGAPLFATTVLAAVPAGANAGSAAPALSRSDPAVPLAPDGYVLAFEGGATGWRLARADGSAEVSGPGPLTIDGLRVEPSGAAAPGDLFLIAEQSGAAALTLGISDSRRVAAAEPFTVVPAAADSSKARAAVVPDASAALPPAERYRFVFTPSGGVEVRDGAGALLAPEQPFTPGTPIAGAGFRLEVTGTPAAGDVFEVASAALTPGNGGAMRRLSAALVGTGGAPGYAEQWDRAAGQLSRAAAGARDDLASARSIESAARSAQEAASGVDLDTEAAKLIRFQQAYQASSRIVQAARDIFDSILAIG
ncbi:MAG: flagellar basal body rod C-terminal domain-containing protein [Sphingomonadaceae bacterium]|nr:flagellar basal body rod C-terminal domain-containing protein [Sphingomonadaceae bacterium]